MNHAEKSNQPDDLISLAGALKSGRLCGVSTKALARAIAFSDPTIAADIRRCADALLERVVSYYGVIKYEGPDYTCNKPSSLYPAARGTKHFYDRLNNNWLLPVFKGGPGADQHDLYENAGALSLDAAFYVAAHELQQYVPESSDCLRQAVWVLCASLHDQHLSGVRWVQVSRRIRAKGAKKILLTLRTELAKASFGVKPDMRTVVIPEGFPTTHFRAVTFNRTSSHA